MDEDEKALVAPSKPSFLASLTAQEITFYADNARRIQLWYAVFHPRFNVREDRGILFRAIYNSGTNADRTCARVLQQWYRVYLVSHRHRHGSRRGSMTVSAKMGRATSSVKTMRLDSHDEVDHHQPDDGSGEIEYMPLVMEAVKEAVSSVIHEWKAANEDEFFAIRDNIQDKDEDEMLKEIRYLSSLRMRVALEPQLPRRASMASTGDVAEREGSNSSNELSADSSLRPGDTLLHFLVQTVPNLTVAVLQEFFRDGLHVHEKGHNERTLLHAAAHGGHVKTVQMLLDEGIDVLATDGYGCTALHDAAGAGTLDVVQYLIDECAVGVNLPNKSGRTPLHYAAEANQVNVLAYLVKKGAHVDAVNRNLRTPLHMAAAKGHVDAVKFLLDEGAEIKATVTGDNMLHDVAKHNHIELMEMFARHPGYERFSIATNHRRRTPMHEAAAASALDVYELLNGNPWGGKHAGLMKDETGCYPLNLLLESEAISLERGLNLTKYIPQNTTSGDHEPLWSDDMFASVVRETPEYAWAYLDAFKTQVSWSCGRSEWSFPRLADIYGHPHAVEKSALASIVDAYNKGDKEKQAYCIRCLSHIVLTRVIHLKWKSFGRMSYFVELFGSVFLVFTTTVCVSLTNVQIEFTKPRYCLLTFAWTTLFVFTIEAIYASVHYSTLKRQIQNSSFLNPPVAITPPSPQTRTKSGRHILTHTMSFRSRVSNFFVPDRLLHRGAANILSTFVRGNSTFLQVTPRGGNAMDSARSNNGKAKRIVLKDKAVVFFLGLIFTSVAISIAAFVTLCVLAVLDDSTASAADKFYKFNLVVRWLLSLIVLGVEGLEFHGSNRRYLRSPWKLLKVAVFLVIILVETPLDLGWVQLHNIQDADAQAILYAITSLALWVNFLQVLRVNESTGPMITMVINMVPDVINFLMMYMVFQMGLTCAYFALLKGQKGFETFGTSFVTTYIILFGQLNVDVVLGQEAPRSIFLSTCVMFQFLIVAIVLVNALIAVLAMTAETVLERVKEQVVFNHAELILRAEITLPQWLRNRLRNQTRGKKAKVSHMTAFAKTIFVRDDDAEVDETMEESVRKIDKSVDKCLDSIRDLTDQMADLQAKLYARLEEESEKTRATLDSIALLLQTTHYGAGVADGSLHRQNSVHRSAIVSTTK
ncbi:Aste57867_24478 [Aphanomyces stellatus]|uniref:Aste57867_24478 protein n=1 Tax=Aphanomyces stellatus TaxID=120398 RepID=A0A485LQG3_9STRA|nr:hypothetical protein As57867_024401 [Aphanomyces stellatus]VFU01117.1 Aste57867_24478 [Aphanomyces stellatus]